MKKKLISAILALSFALTLTACGEEEKSFSKESGSSEVSSSVSSTISQTSEASSSEAPKPDDPVSSQESTSSESVDDDEQFPKIVESRIYVSKGNHSWNYRIDIYDNGGWIISQELGNKEVYASYSFDDEAAGKFTTVQGYTFISDPPEHSFEGNARFKMTEETLTVTFEDEDPNIFYRHSLDVPLDDPLDFEIDM